jgi:hypothetical protein
MRKVVVDSSTKSGYKVVQIVASTRVYSEPQGGEARKRAERQGSTLANAKRIYADAMQKIKDEWILRKDCKTIRRIVVQMSKTRG